MILGENSGKRGARTAAEEPRTVTFRRRRDGGFIKKEEAAFLSFLWKKNFVADGDN